MQFMFGFSRYIFKRRALENLGLWQLSLVALVIVPWDAANEYCVSANQREDHKQIYACMRSWFTGLLILIHILSAIHEEKCCEESWLPRWGSAQLLCSETLAASVTSFYTHQTAQIVHLALPFTGICGPPVIRSQCLSPLWGMILFHCPPQRLHLWDSKVRI